MSKKILGGLILAGLTYFNYNSEKKDSKISSRNNESDISTRNNNLKKSRKQFKLVFIDQYGVKGNVILTQNQYDRLKLGSIVKLGGYYLFFNKSGNLIGLKIDNNFRQMLKTKVNFIDQNNNFGSVRLTQSEINFLMKGYTFKKRVGRNTYIFVLQTDKNGNKFLRGIFLQKYKSNLFKFTSQR